MEACLPGFNKKDAENASIARNGEELLSQSHRTIIEVLAIPHISLKSCHYNDCCYIWNAATYIECCHVSLASNLPSNIEIKGERIDPFDWGFCFQKYRMMPVTVT